MLAVALAVGLAMGGAHSASAASFTNPDDIKHDKIMLENGHIDAFNVVSTGIGKIDLVLKEDVSAMGTLRTPESVILKVKNNAKYAIPENYKTFFKPLQENGLTDEFYWLPDPQNQELLWPGSDSMGARDALGVDSNDQAQADHVIDKVVSPEGGRVLMWSSNFGEVIPILSEGKFALPGTIHQPVLIHQHMNWTFTKAGTYKITAHSKVSETGTGKSLETAAKTYTFQVGDVDKQALREEVNAANTLVSADYTTESWDAYQRALERANAVLNDKNTTQSDADAAGSSLKDARVGLQKITKGYDPKTGGRTEFDAGKHVSSIYPQIVNGFLQVKAADDQEKTIDSNKALYRVSSDKKKTLPAGYDFLAKEGTTVWTSSSTPVFSAEGIAAADVDGPITIAYDDFAYAAPLDESGANAAPPRFSVTQSTREGSLTQLIVPGSQHRSVSLEAGGHKHVDWMFTRAGVYDINFTVTTKLKTGGEVSGKTTVRFVVGDMENAEGEPQIQQDNVPEVPDAKALTITPEKSNGKFFVGQRVKLKAESSAAQEGDSYNWYSTPANGGAEVLDEKQQTNEFSSPALRSMNGTRVRVERVSGGTTVEKSEPITIAIDVAKPTTTLSSTADKDTYNAQNEGGTAHLNSIQNPQTDADHYHWYIKLAGSDEYVWINGSVAASHDLPITPNMNGATVVARVFDGNKEDPARYHAVLAESPALRLKVENGSNQVNIFDVTADKTSYSANDQATFTADATNADSIVWSIRKYGENVYSPLASDGSKELKTAVGPDWGWAEVRAVYKSGDAIIGEGSYTIGALGTDNPDATTGVDRTALKSAIDKASKLDSKDYTSESWSSFSVFLADARKIWEKINATQSEVDNAATKLDAAQKALVRVLQPSDTGGDKTRAEASGNSNKGTTAAKDEAKRPNTLALSGSPVQTVGMAGAVIALAAIAMLTISTIRRI